MPTPFTFAKTLPKGILGALLALTLFLPNLASAVTQCDREAGHGLDPADHSPGRR